jgi:hypothetical protein
MVKNDSDKYIQPAILLEVAAKCYQKPDVGVAALFRALIASAYSSFSLGPYRDSLCAFLI